MTELLPCPACQSLMICTFERDEGLFIVSCENDDSHFTVETCGSTMAEAIERWNTCRVFRPQWSGPHAREAAIRAVQLSCARNDLEPTSEATLALYRKDAEHAADAVIATLGGERSEVRSAEATVDQIANIVSDYYDEDDAGRWLKCAQHIADSIPASAQGAVNSDNPSLWVCFADNGNIRAWTSDHNRKEIFRLDGLDMQPFYASPESLAKATRGKAGTAGINDPVRRSTVGTGLQVGEAVAVQPAPSENMDVTAGETAPNYAAWANAIDPDARTPGDELGPSELIRIELRQTMLDCWNSICADTDCHPLDIKHQGKKLFFTPDHWADMVAWELASRLSHHASMRDLISSGRLPQASPMPSKPEHRWAIEDRENAERNARLQRDRDAARASALPSAHRGGEA